MFEEVVEFHLCQAEHNVSEFRSVVDLPFQDILPPAHQYDSVNYLDLTLTIVILNGGHSLKNNAEKIIQS